MTSGCVAETAELVLDVGGSGRNCSRYTPLACTNNVSKMPMRGYALSDDRRLLFPWR
jgi:hypothetical protein